jgi:hypothetical protein
MVPPVADHVIELLEVSVTENCCIPPGGRLLEGGFTAKDATVICVADV